MTIYEKLLEVQHVLKAPKGQQNTFGGYKYRNCEDILEAVKPHLYQNKATIILSDELVVIGERYYIKATATFIDCTDGTKIENTAYAREEEVKKGMDGSQITGSSSSYARKYALNGLLDIDDTKDSDATNVELINKDQIARMMELKVNTGNVLQKFKINKLEELTSSQAEEIIRVKENALRKAASEANNAN